MNATLPAFVGRFALIITDRLGQYAASAPASDTSRLLQARAPFRLAENPDIDYLMRRIHEEGGDPALLGLPGGEVGQTMPTFILRDYLTRVEARKAALGMVDTPAETEAMRNKGAGRTPEKRELLCRAKARATAAGKPPLPSHY